MVWRKGPDGKTPGPEKAARHAAMAALADKRTRVGILGYRRGVPVAWCSIAPRSTCGKGLAAVLPGDAGLNLWSLVCFFVAAPYRKTGRFGLLLTAAEIEAGRQGAELIKAYPVAPDSPSYRFSGFVPNFEAEGYRHVGKEGLRRTVVRQALVQARNGTKATPHWPTNAAQSCAVPPKASRSTWPGMPCTCPVAVYCHRTQC